MRTKLTKNQFGFTIVELLMATVVFSVVLLIVTTGIIKISQSYYRGIIQNRTQEAVRNVSEEISRTIQLANGQKVLSTANAGFGTSGGQFCVGAVRYTYGLNEKIGDPGAVGLKAEKVPPNDCNAASVPTNVTQLLSKNMRLLRFKVEPDPLTQDKTYRIDIRVAYGDNDLLSHYNDDGSPIRPAPADVIDDADGAVCKSGVSGGSFCATAQLDTLVKKRLSNI